MQNNGLRNGLVGGALVILYFSAIYLIDRPAFLNPWLQWASMAIYLAFMIRAAKADCAEHGTQRDFREIIRTPFVVFILINLFYWLFYYGLHLADVELVRMELLAEKSMLQTQIDQGIGDPQQANQLRERILDVDKALEHPAQPLGPVLSRMAMGALGGFALSAAIAAVLRSQE